MIRNVNPKLLREPRHWGRRDRQVLALTVLTILLWMIIMYLALLSGEQSIGLFPLLRYGAVIPVAVTAYYYGVGAGVTVALFFNSAFWMELYPLSLRSGLSLITLEQVAISLILFVVAYVVADLSSSVQSQTALRLAVRDREALLSRTSNLNKVTGFILRSARQALDADEAAIILSNPLNGQWELITSDTKHPLPEPGEQSSGSLTLAQWLVERSSPMYLQDLDAPDSILLPVPGGERPPRSLLTRPLKHSNGSKLGCLVVIRENGYNFAQSDMQVLDDLVLAGQKALEQAGLYARTDFALEQRMSQLAAIQRTTRELNSNFDMRNIIDLTLQCAIEITGAESGTIILDVDDLIQLIHTRAMEVTNRQALLNLEQAILSGKTPVLLHDEMYLPPFFPRTQSQSLALIQRRGQTLGAVVVECPQPQAFDETSDWALSLLTDHVAIALENARLFSEIQKEKQQIGLIIDSIADGLITSDWEGHILTMNPAAEKLTGYTAGSLAGQHLNNIFRISDEIKTSELQPPERLLNLLKSGTVDKLVVRQRLGSKLVASVSVAPVVDEQEKPVGLVVLFRDITRQEELDRLQQELIAAISHEMRTPLTKISSIAETLQEQMAHQLTGRQAQHLEIMVAETQRLARFLDRMLNVHRLESANFDFQIRPIPINFIIEETIQHWRKTVPNFEFVLKESGTLWVQADENSLFLVLNNLLDNAVKYSPGGTRIEVSMEATPDERVLVSVKDQGKGIPAEAQTRIFERFYRVDGGDAQVVYGHGLGLYITKILVNAMEGDIWVESEPGQGSQFTFNLPMARTSAVLEEKPIETQNPGH